MQTTRVSSVIDKVITLETSSSVILCVLLGSQISLIPFAPLAGLAGLALLPAFWPAVRNFLGMAAIICLIAFAVFAGAGLTLLNDTTHSTSAYLLASRSAMMLALAGGIAVVLYARRHIGNAGAAISYGIGMLGAIALEPASASNSWRFTYSIPIAILLLALLSYRARFVPQLLGLVALATIGFVNESRANSAILLLAAIVLLWQRLARSLTRGRRTAGHVAGILLFAIGFAQLLQFSILEGYLGEATQVKTQAQVETSGNLLLGGRPEAAASFSLIQRYPFGLGTGILPTDGDVYAAKSSMSAIGYDPNNGYVERFMFGNGIEVHSVLGDFWIWFGLAGLVMAASMVWVVAMGLENRLRSSTLTALLAFLSIRFVWDLLFSPAASSMKLFVILIPLIAIAVHTADTADTGTPRHISTRVEPFSARR